MPFSHLNTRLLLRLLLIVLLTAGAAISGYLGVWLIAAPTLFLLLLLLGDTLRGANALNHKVAFFFDAIRNEDNTLLFPEHSSDKSLQHLHKSLNRVNRMISEIRVKNEHNQRFFLEFMKHAASGFIVVDEKGYIDIINNKALRLCGMGYLSHIQRLRQRNPVLYDAMMAAVPDQAYTLRWLKGHEMMQVSLKVVALSFREKSYRIYSLYDIRLEMEENELESWHKLIRILTHEIMNSIAPITSLSKTLRKFYIKDGYEISAEHLTQKEINNTLQGLAVIEERGEGLMRFVDSYRRLTKLPKPNFKPVNIQEWLQTIQWLARKRMEDDQIELAVVQGQAENIFLADEQLLTQVVINLLNNAADALVQVKEKRISLTVSDTEEGRIRITVKDNGQGFRSEEIENIFIPFYTTKENGSGIGLSLSRQIMRLHKGSIAAWSEPEKETVFELLL